MNSPIVLIIVTLDTCITNNISNANIHNICIWMHCKLKMVTVNVSPVLNLWTGLMVKECSKINAFEKMTCKFLYMYQFKSNYLKSWFTKSKNYFWFFFTCNKKEEYEKKNS
jgi:hypothetical protein